MTFEELYEKVKADDALKAELAAAAKEGKVAEWTIAQGVEGTVEEIHSYARAAASDGQELTDEQLEKVAGGGMDPDGVYRCDKCGYVGEGWYVGCHLFICPVCELRPKKRA